VTLSEAISLGSFATGGADEAWVLQHRW